MFYLWHTKLYGSEFEFKSSHADSNLKFLSSDTFTQLPNRVWAGPSGYTSVSTISIPFQSESNLSYVHMITVFQNRIELSASREVLFDYVSSINNSNTYFSSKLCVQKSQVIV